jgi:DNA-binding NtrC family response regulator
VKLSSRDWFATQPIQPTSTQGAFGKPVPSPVVVAKLQVPGRLLGRIAEMVSPNVMVVSQNLEIQQAFAHVLGKCGLAPIISPTASEAETILEFHPIALIFCSDKLPDGGINGLIRRAKQTPGQVPVVIVSRCSEWRHCLSFLKQGALDFVLYPLSQVEVERVVNNALSLIELQRPRQAASA